MNNLVLIYTPFNKLVIKALIDQGLLDRNSLIIDHTEKKSDDFVNYYHLNNNARKLTPNENTNKTRADNTTIFNEIFLVETSNINNNASK